MIQPALTLEQQLSLTMFRTSVLTMSEAELREALLFTYEQYLLADNYRRVSAAEELVGASRNDKHLLKFQVESKECSNE
jgi:hypothetical protein